MRANGRATLEPEQSATLRQKLLTALEEYNIG